MSPTHEKSDLIAVYQLTIEEFCDFLNLKGINQSVVDVFKGKIFLNNIKLCLNN